MSRHYLHLYCIGYFGIRLFDVYVAILGVDETIRCWIYNGGLFIEIDPSQLLYNFPKLQRIS